MASNAVAVCVAESVDRAPAQSYSGAQDLIRRRDMRATKRSVPVFVVFLQIAFGGVVTARADVGLGLD